MVEYQDLQRMDATCRESKATFTMYESRVLARLVDSPASNQNELACQKISIIRIPYSACPH